MKILLVSPVFPGSLGNSCQWGFAELGHAVEVFDYRSQAFGIGYLGGKRRSLLDRIASRLVPSVPRMNRRLIGAVERLRPDLALVIKGELVLPETVQTLTGRLGLPTLLWYPDAATFLSTRPAHQNITHSLPHYTISFLAVRHGLAPEVRQTARRLEYLTFGCDPRQHYRRDLAPGEQAHYGSSLCFIGNTHGEASTRDRILGGLLDLDLKIWGTAWERSPLYPRRPEVFRPAAYGDELVKVYSASRIALNINGDYPVMNVRNFEAPACGILLLTSAIPPLPEYFRPDEEVVTYHELGELRDKAAYYLAHEDRRFAVAQAGRRRALKDHTLKNRLGEMLAYLSNP